MLHELESIALIFLAWPLEVKARLYIMLLHFDLYLSTHLIIDKVRGSSCQWLLNFISIILVWVFIFIFFASIFLLLVLIFSSIYYSSFYYYQVFMKCLSFLYSNNTDIPLLLAALKISAKKSNKYGI